MNSMQHPCSFGSSPRLECVQPGASTAYWTHIGVARWARTQFQHLHWRSMCKAGLRQCAGLQIVTYDQRGV